MSMTLQATTSQTVGPFFKIGMDWLGWSNVSDPRVAGERITIRGRMLDGNLEGVCDGVLEIWQADSQGKYAQRSATRDSSSEPDFAGFGRIPTDDAGTFCFTTIKPGRVPGPKGRLQAPHIVVSVFARGLLRRLITRIYFPDDPNNKTDFALNQVDPARRETLIAKKSGSETGTLEWNIILQGDNETVFFDCGL
jgi:protocatechuate 3,4-dioxygenase, alpha subunit